MSQNRIVPSKFSILGLLPDYIFLFPLLFLCHINSYALDTLNFSLQRIDADIGQLEDLKFTLSHLQKDHPTLTLTVNSITLPAPYDSIRLVNIQCPEIILRNDSVSCPEGKAELQSRWTNLEKIRFGFFYSEQKSHLYLRRISMAGGTLTVSARKQGDHWQMKLHALNIDATFLQKNWPLEGIETVAGKLDIDVTGKGKSSEITHLESRLAITDGVIQNSEATLDIQKLGLTSTIRGRYRHGGWQFSSKVHLRKGAIYLEPVYIEAENRPVSAAVTGFWHPDDHRLLLQTLDIDQPQVMNLHAQGRMDTGNLDNVRVALKIDDLETASKLYLAPFLSATAMEGLGFSGKLDAHFKFVQQSLTDLRMSFFRLNITDPEGQLSLQGGMGAINWSSQTASPRKSTVSWQQMTLFSLPFDASTLVFSTTADALKLEQPATLSLLNGQLILKQFFMRIQEPGKPEVHFQGAIEHVSLEQLTENLNWQPLTGTIDGVIPGISYRDDKLNIDGSLKIRVFDGEVLIRNLALSGLFSPLPKLYLDMDIERLNLDRITRKFDFGSMQGRLSGHIRNLYLENWEPITFYAWLGTPEDDDSRHRISQKAINNLAAIGGGGMTDLLSRTFLRFFQTFNYDQVGIGCYLHEGVCQLMGLSPIKNGFYIVKGRGLPRIDIIGFNTRIDWKVLLQRLSRISSQP